MDKCLTNNMGGEWRNFMNLDALAQYLDLTAQELRETGISQNDIYEDPGDKVDLINNYYFNVPDKTPQHILGKKNWSIGERIDFPGEILDL
ncbi:hypothetical protein SC171_16810 [Pantoea cypripedii]|uniref:hypothetical protein n=1 Tax=Pantoea cypripedii TaxID=55209 RepID=UPI002FC75089